MALTAKQKELKTLLTTGAAASTVRGWPDPDAPNGVVEKTLAEWVANGNASLLNTAVNDPALGAELGLQVEQTLIQSSSINEAVAEGKEFPAEIGQQTLASLSFVLQHSTFDFTKKGVVESIETLLSPYQDCLAKFHGLKSKPDSINAALFEGKLTIDDVSIITDPNQT